MRTILFSLTLFVMSSFSNAHGQNAQSADQHVAFAQSIYWTALTPTEKQTFLFAYISSAYETRNLANKTIQVSPRKTHHFNEEIDNLFVIWQSLLEMEDTGGSAMEEFIGWIDLYFEIDVNKTKPFGNAIRYAFQKIKSDDKSVLELFWGRSTAPVSQLPKDEDLEQKSIERKIAASEARKSVDTAAELNLPIAYKPMSSEAQTAFVLTAEEKDIIALAVETECLHKNQADLLQDPVFLETLAQKHHFESIQAFNIKFSEAQTNSERWKYMNKQIIELAFDQNCM